MSPCLRAITTTANSYKNKLTTDAHVGTDLTVTAPHSVKALLRDATNWWISNVPLTQHQALPLDKDKLTFNKSLAIN